MARSLKIKDYYLVSQVGKMFRLDLSKTALLKKEDLGIIPKAERHQRGSSHYRVWKKDSLPKMGEALGYLKKPSSCKTISVFSLKGGTGKTSCAFQMARTMALHNVKTLVIGLDTQQSITQTIRRSQPANQENEGNSQGIFHILAEGLDPKEAVQKTDLPSLDFIPETIELSILDRFLKTQVRKEYVILEKIVEPLRDAYDLILFDCNPSWTDIVTSTLAATDILVSPLGCDVNSLKAAKIFVELLDDFQSEMRHEFERFFIVPTLVENNKLSHQILSKYRINYADLCTVASIRRTVTVQEANVLGRSLMEVFYTSSVYQDFAGMFREINEAMLDVEQESVPVEENLRTSVAV